MTRTPYISFVCFVIIICCCCQSFAQNNPLRRFQGAGGGNVGGSGSPKDSLAHRTGLEDSITILYRYLDTSRYNRPDSNINDFTNRFPIPSDYIYLGNIGNAARPVRFSPVKKAGWDPGFHAYDIYQQSFRETRFYNTTRPFSELGYMLGSRTEQMISLLHTQNVTPDWNAAFQFKMINSPGLFINQNTNHSSYRLNSSYQSKNRRYHAFFILINNKIQSSENGGIRDMADMNNLITYKDRSNIPVQIGNTGGNSRNVFSSSITTGTKYRNFNFMFRQQYDLGKKDSIVTDSTVVQLFYPKVRIEHTFVSSAYTYSFSDLTSSDTSYYRRFYDFLQNPANVFVQDKWNELSNDISLYQFPDEKNAQQFIKAGATLQNLRGVFDGGNSNYFNFFGHGEYRNKTRNKKWDIEANGALYFAGLNAGDYDGTISLKRYISKQIGYLQAGFQNINRTPSFVFNNASSFSIGGNNSFNKENITHIFGSLEQPERKLNLSGHYYLITNYTYFRDYYHASQSGALFNLLQVSADKEFHLTRHLKWYAHLTLQQKAGNAPVNVPLFFTRNRIGYEGSLGFKNLLFLVGTEIRYHTPYKADGYSPMLGQFYFQDTATVRLKFPEIAAYLHFRIKTFTAYVRAENLNSASLKEGFGWTNNNFAAPGYPYPGFLIRLGIFWKFIN